MKKNPEIMAIPKQLKIFRQKALSLTNNTVLDEQRLIRLIRNRLDSVINVNKEHLSLEPDTIKPPRLLVNSVLRHMFHYYNEIVAYLYGISTSIDFESKWFNKNKANVIYNGQSVKRSLRVKELFQLVDTHKKRILSIEVNPELPINDYHIHLEKIAFFEKLFKFNQKYTSSNGLSSRFFKEDTVTQQFFECCFNLTASNLFLIDESIEKLRKLYRLTHQTNVGTTGDRHLVEVRHNNLG